MIDLRATLRKLLLQNVSPHKVASGSAIGIFFGFLPFFGVKTLLSYFTSLSLRVNTAAAIIAVTLHDLLLPVLPVILRVEYQLGFWLLATPHQFAPRLKLQNLGVNPFHSWKDVERIGGPLLLGSVLIGLAAAAVAYVVAYAFFRHRQVRREFLARRISPEETTRGSENPS